MKLKLLFSAALVWAAPFALQADFRYVQESQITGGAMQSAMKVAGVFSKKAREPIRSEVVFKGARMATISEDQITITDLDARTITTIEPKKKRYSVVTFDQMKAFMDKMTAKAKKQKQEQGAEVQFHVSVEKTGQKKMVHGLPAQEYDIKLQIEGKNEKTGESGAMDMLMQSWMSDPVHGYSEVRDYYRRFGEQIDWMPGSASALFAAGNQGAAKGLGQVYEEAAKIQGMPVLQVVSMGSGDLKAASQGSAGQPKQEEHESMGSALKKGLGGFGGFGRKKKKEKAAKPAAGNEQPAAAKLVEMTIRYSEFSAAEVDASLVDTEPAGYKKVTSHIEKALR